jgi:hypothetical protein
MAEKTNGATAPKKAQSGGITKTEAVRRALATLGNDAMPLAIQGFVKKQFAIDMPLPQIYNRKSEILTQARSKKPAAAKQAAQQAGAPKAAAQPAVKPVAPKAAAPKPAAAKPAAQKPAAKAAPASQVNGRTGRGIDLGDIQTVKELVGRVGADSLKTLIDLLSK